ncbi:hypothetical protein [Microbispora sp. NPDC049125]|uniref:hypothetical protein n=1 Tax=Microbispora sp. NPDC049125 TaxID=3154929 RepID=UPI00346742FC
MLRETVALLSLDAQHQVTEPSIDECFDWDPSYPASWQSKEMGWISSELSDRLDAIDGLLDQLSDDSTAWSDEAIATYPLWEHVRQAAGDALALMPEAPWDSTSSE